MSFSNGHTEKNDGGEKRNFYKKFFYKKSIGVRYLVIVFSKRPLDVSAGFLAVSVRSWVAKQPEFTELYLHIPTILCM